MPSRLSIRTRITLGSAAVAAILLLVALLVVRSQVVTILSSADLTLARSDLTSFEKDISAQPEESVDDPGTGVLVLVRNPDGVVDVNTLPHDVLIRVAGLPATDDQFAMTDDEGRAYVVVGRALPTTAGTWSLWSARSTSASELAVAGLDRVLVIGGVVLLVAFALASWLLATVALRPVGAMRREAEALRDGGALAVPATRDELADLATTLNGFLGRVQSASARERQMVSDAAHELRTPLAVLKTQLELARHDRDDAAALARQLAAAEISVDRLASLASNLLALSRLEAHDADPASPAPVLVDEFTAAIDRARTLAPAASTVVDFDLVIDDESARYRIDPQAFGRLTDNLLSNALNAVAGGGRVTARLAQGSGGIELRVSDDGPGMPSDFVPVAFERFSRPDASRTTATGGSGLGLALVQALAREAGGGASLRNIHPGLEVTVTLPKI